MEELDVLVAQLDELLGAGIVDTSDALELVTCAGLAERLGASADQLADVRAWRAGAGNPLLAELWEEASAEPLAETIEGLLGADAEDRVVEDAVFDFDDFVAAALWCGQRKKVAASAREVAATIRLAPEIFTVLAPYGVQMAKLRGVGEEFALYDYWFAIADLAATP